MNWIKKIFCSDKETKEVLRKRSWDEYYKNNEERQKEIDARIERFKEDNPLKYKSGDKFFHWVVYNGYFICNEWHGYGTHNKDRPRNEYGVVNFVTGEIKQVEERFLDDLSEANKNME